MSKHSFLRLLKHQPFDDREPTSDSWPMMQPAFFCSAKGAVHGLSWHSDRLCKCTVPVSLSRAPQYQHLIDFSASKILLLMKSSLHLVTLNLTCPNQMHYPELWWKSANYCCHQGAQISCWHSFQLWYLRRSTSFDVGIAMVLRELPSTGRSVSQIPLSAQHSGLTWALGRGPWTWLESQQNIQ